VEGYDVIVVGARCAGSVLAARPDPEAGQQWRDRFTRLRRPSEVFTAERRASWAAAWQQRPRLRAGACSG
jgi:hypothetical protein